MTKKLKELVIVSLLFGFLITSVTRWTDSLNGFDGLYRGHDIMCGFPFSHYRDCCRSSFCFCREFYFDKYLLNILFWSSSVGVGWYLLQRIQEKYEQKA